MTPDPLAVAVALIGATNQARSALPDAPVMSDRGDTAGAVRRGAASILYRLADRLDRYPAAAQLAQPTCAGMR
jgi:hypothetical protein